LNPRSGITTYCPLHGGDRAPRFPDPPHITHPRRYLGLTAAEWVTASILAALALPLVWLLVTVGALALAVVAQ